METVFVFAQSLLGGDGDALFGEVLGSAGMIRNIGDAGGKLDAALGALGVGGGDLVQIVENAGDEVVDVGVGNVVAGQNQSGDGDVILTVKNSG